MKLKLSKLKTFFLCVFIGTTIAVFGQSSTIRGVALDVDSVPVPFAAVIIGDNQYFGQTGMEGEFEVKVDAGKYKVIVEQFPLKFELNNVIALAGGVKNMGTILLKSETIEVEVVEIVVNNDKNTDQKVLDDKKKAAEVKDVMSAETIKKSGDGDVAGAMKRVTGVSVVEGKYVYVRGLGDRYNKTTLNGMEIPGLDPDRNAVQMDIFPTNLVSNISVSKSFVASLPADFSGGIVDVNLKSFPNRNGGAFSVGLGYNPNMHFNNEYLAYRNGSGDVFAYGAKGREKPQYNPLISNPEMMSKFNSTMAGSQQMSLLNYSLGADYGGKKVLNKGTLGYNVAVSYSENTKFYQDAFQGRYALNTNPDETDLIARSLQTGDYGENEVLVSFMTSLAYKTKHSSYRFNVLRLQNATNKAAEFDFENILNAYSAKQYNLEYSQRQLINYFIEGAHTLKDSVWNLKWKLSPTFSRMDDPDVRSTRYRKDAATPYGTEAGLPTRIWREMNESNYSGRIDLTRLFEFNGEEGKFMLGGAATLKERDFAIDQYQYNVINYSALTMGDDPNEIMYSQNIYGSADAPPNAGFSVQPPSSFAQSDPNKFNSKSNYYAGYVSAELMLAEKLKTVAGLRAELFQLLYTGYDINKDIALYNEEMLNDLDFFPTISFIYKVNKNQNVRLSSTKTIARPSFKEMSFATIIDPISGITFNGGRNAFSGWDGDLKSTDIYNFDLRWEIFLKKAQTFSVSTFYKQFINPIEVVQIDIAAGNFQPRNVGNAQVYGAEFEAKKRLGFINKSLSQFVFNVNYTFTVARVKMSDIVKESKELNKRTGEEVGEYRDMAGQSPFLINSGLAYEGAKKGYFKGFKAGVYYNVQGKTLQYVGITERPDVYANPFHSLNFTASKKFGKDHQYKVSLKANNILGDDREEVFVSYGSADRLFSSLSPMRTFTGSFSIKF